MKLEVVVIPVIDVDRSKTFYSAMGWRLDADFTAHDGLRVVQFTPSGSACSIIFGANITPAAPGSARGLHHVVEDVEVVRQELTDRGIGVSDVFHEPWPNSPSWR